MAKSPKTLAAKAVRPESVSSLKLPEATIAENQKPVSFGGLDLVITKVSALPPDATSQRATRATALPFPELFDSMGVGAHFFLPDVFWAARKADPANKIKSSTDMNSTYIKGKVRTAFDKWRKSDASRTDYNLVVYTRPNGISPKDDPSFPEDPRPGHSLYILQNDK